MLFVRDPSSCARMDIPDRYDVFISYSRHDTAFAEQLRDQLTLAGKACWMDHSHIGHGEEWWPSILSAIERSACFLCLVSARFQQSRYCLDEAAHARAMKKKIVQVLHQDVAAIPPAVEHITAIPWTPADSAAAIGALVRAVIERDFAYDRQRRELLAKALEWTQAGRPASLLLRGSVLADARLLLARCLRDRLALAPQRQLLAASLARRRRARGAAAVCASAALLLAVAATLTQAASSSRERAAAATALAASDPVAALVQGIAAVHAAATSEAEAALRSALLASPPSRIFHAGAGATHALPLADGRVALIGDDGKLRLCRLDAPRCTVVASGIGPVDSVLADPRGTWFVAASSQRVWHYGASGLRVLYQGGSADAVTGLVASADGATIAVTRAGAPALLLAQAAAAPVALALANARPLALSADGARIALDVTRGGRRYLEVWAVGRSLELTRRVSASLRIDAGPPARFSPDGRALAFGGEYEAVSLWHFEQPGAPLRLPHDQSREEAPWRVLALDFRADGKRLVSAGEDRTARVWEVASGRLTAILRGHAGAVRQASFSPDGLLLATAADDHSARSWSAADGRPLATMGGAAQHIRQARFSPDGMALLTDGADGSARAYPAAFGYPYLALAEQENLVHSIEFSPDAGTLLGAASDGAARLWRLAQGDSVVLPHSLPHSRAGAAPALRQAHFSPDGVRIVSAAGDCTFRVWRNGELEAELREVAAGCSGGQARFIDAATLWLGSRQGISGWTLGAGKWSRNGVIYRRGVDDFALSPDGRWLAGRDGAGLTLVDRSGRRPDWTVDAAGTVSDMAFSRDSSRLVVARNAPIVDVWNIGTQQRAGYLIGHRDAVLRAAFNGDGSLLATTSADGSVLLWDWRNARPLAELTGQAGSANAVAFSPAGDRIAVGGTDNVVRLYQCPVCGSAADVLGVATRQLAALRDTSQ